MGSTLIKPAYYNVDVIDVIEYARLTLGFEAAKAFCRVNVIKYLVRYDQKNGIEDLNKAMTYLTRLLEMEKDEHESKN